MSNLLTRAITGAVFVAVLATCIILSPYSNFLLFMVLSVIGAHEFSKLYSSFAPRVSSLFITGSVLFAFLLLAGISVGVELKYSFLILLMPLLGIMMDLERNGEPPFAYLTQILIALFYIALPFSLLVLLSFSIGEYYEWRIQLGFFLLLWANDTFAYLTGRWLGKNKLWESISPKKTIEGFVGGLIFCVGTGFLIAQFWDVLPAWKWMGMSAIVAIAGTLGDLSESLLKRKAGVKDSGNILPGHGGVLDRFDGITLAIPLVSLFLYFSKFGL